MEAVGAFMRVSWLWSRGMRAVKRDRVLALAVKSRAVQSILTIFIETAVQMFSRLKPAQGLRVARGTAAQEQEKSEEEKGQRGRRVRRQTAAA